jgi:hypothetical protein
MPQFYLYMLGYRFCSSSPCLSLADDFFSQIFHQGTANRSTGDTLRNTLKG